MSLQDSGAVTVITSKQIQPLLGGLLKNWADQWLPNAQRTAVAQLELLVAHTQDSSEFSSTWK